MNFSQQLNRLASWIFRASLGVIACLTLFALLMVRGQIIRDEKFKNKLRPAIRFVETYKTEHRKFPKEDEFQNWLAEQRYETMEFMTWTAAESTVGRHGGHPGDYCLRVWRGESWTYYYSWNKRFNVSDEF